MKRSPAPRIATEHAPFSGLQNPFAALSDIQLSPATAQPTAELQPNLPVDPEWKMGRVVLQRQTAHRGGKTVIVIHDFATHLPATLLERIGKKLRAACGCGGTVKARQIEIQGDQIAKIRCLLEAEGFQVAGVR